MKRFYAFLVSSILLLVLSSGEAQMNRMPRNQERSSRNRMRSMWNASGLKVGSTLPDLSVYEADGKKVKLNSLLNGHYTVIVSGCLTCPVYLRGYPGIEAVYKDYSPRGVHFYFLYQSLAHPENRGYIQPFTLEERLAHVQEAKQTLGTSIPWICDGMSNEVKNALGNRPNSEFVFDPAGKIISMRDWSNSEQLRKDLVMAVGSVDKPTTVADLYFPEVIPMNMPTQGVVPRIQVPEQLIPVITAPRVDENPYYVKLRAEVDNTLLQTGTGKMYLGFHLDPIHHVHWNNLVDPVQYTMDLPAGTTVTPPNGSGPTVGQPSDKDPREFLVDVENWTKDKSIGLTVDYFACSETEGWCIPVTQHYSIQLQQDRNGGGVMGRSFRGGGSRQGRNRQNVGRQFMRFDSDGDGKISKAEAPNRLKERFNRIDANGDNFIDEEEMKQMMERFRGNGQ